MGAFQLRGEDGLGTTCDTNDESRLVGKKIDSVGSRCIDNIR